MEFKNKEIQMRRLASRIMTAFYQEDNSGKFLYSFIKELCKLTRLKSYGINDEYKLYVIKKDDYKKLEDLKFEEEKCQNDWQRICDRLNNMTEEEFIEYLLNQF